MQKLILPIKNTLITAGYKNAKYKAEYGWNHFGMDFVSSTDRTIYSPGNGEVVAAGMDGEELHGAKSRLGNVLVIIFRDVDVGGTPRNIACRMYHLDSIKVKEGDKVTQGQPIAVYGNTGSNGNGAHLHFELDTDINWPTLAPGVKIGAGKIINRQDVVSRAGGTADSTISPAKVLFVREGQTIGTNWMGSWVMASDVAMRTTGADELGELRAENEELKAKIQQMRDAIGRYETILDKIRWFVNEYDDDPAPVKAVQKPLRAAPIMMAKDAPSLIENSVAKRFCSDAWDSMADSETVCDIYGNHIEWGVLKELKKRGYYKNWKEKGHSTDGTNKTYGEEYAKGEKDPRDYKE